MGWIANIQSQAARFQHPAKVALHLHDQRIDIGQGFIQLRRPITGMHRGVPARG